MNFSFSTVVNISVTGSILIFLIYLLVRNNRAIACFGTSLALVCSFIVLLRFLLPFEYSFTRSIYIKPVLLPAYRFFTNTLFVVGTYDFNLWKLLFVLWIFGSICLLLGSAVAYHKDRRAIASCESVENLRLLEIVAEKNKSFRHPKEFELVWNSKMESPMIFGLAKPYIILPRMELTDDEWSYILTHEMTHFYFGHLWIKLFCELLCDFYWWNPVIYLLRKFISNLLEMDVDAKVTRQLDETDALDYNLCLLTVAKQILLQSDRRTRIATFSSRDSTLIRSRSELIVQNIESGRKLYMPCISIIAALVVFLFCSFAFIVEPDTYEQDKPVYSMYNSFKTPGNFIIDNANGTYDIYFEWEYSYTESYLYDYDPDIRVYSNYKEAIKNEEELH